MKTRFHSASAGQGAVIIARSTQDGFCRATGITRFVFLRSSVSSQWRLWRAVANRAPSLEFLTWYGRFDNKYPEFYAVA